MRNPLDAVFGRPVLTPKEAAALLHTTPSALADLEAAYARVELSEAGTLPENYFEVNAKQAAAANRRGRADALPASKDDQQTQAETLARIVSELVQDTPVYDTTNPQQEPARALPRASARVGVEDIARAFTDPKTAPALAGDLFVTDIPHPAYPSVLFFLARAARARTPQERTQEEMRAAQGLSTLNMDPILHAMLGANPVSMGNWLPALQRAAAQTGFFRIPETRVARVSLPIMALTRTQDYMEMSPATLEAVDRWAESVFRLDRGRNYFIRTGTYSSKYDFRNAHIQAPGEVAEVGRYFLFLQQQAEHMAHYDLSGRNQPSIVGPALTNEWVVREWVEDRSGAPTIYHGMPLRTEYRVFLDADDDRVLAVAPYWEPKTMLERFEGRADADSPHMRHDAAVFRYWEPTLMARFEANRERVAAEVQRLLPHLDWSGQWSLDVMQNDVDGEEMWLIDAAPLQTSALAEYVPEDLRKPAVPVDWASPVRAALEVD